MERSLGVLFPVKNGTASSAASDGVNPTYASLQPPVGQLYIVDFASMFHDDNAAARVLYWYWYDGSTRTALYATAAAVTNGLYYPVYRGDYGAPSGGHPFVCSYASYLQAALIAGGAGKKVYLQYVVRVVHGVEPWTNA